MELPPGDIWQYPGTFLVVGEARDAVKSPALHRTFPTHRENHPTPNASRSEAGKPHTKASLTNDLLPILQDFPHSHLTASHRPHPSKSPLENTVSAPSPSQVSNVPGPSYFSTDYFSTCLPRPRSLDPNLLCPASASSSQDIHSPINLFSLRRHIWPGEHRVFSPHRMDPLCLDESPINPLPIPVGLSPAAQPWRTLSFLRTTALFFQTE